MLNDDQPPSTFPSFHSSRPPPSLSPFPTQEGSIVCILRLSPLEEKDNVRLTSVGERSERLDDDGRLLRVVESVDLRRVRVRRGGHSWR